ncbi:MAG: ATP synthase F1 subunit gamma [Oscillospiraceae bacterium]|nr:ATP synthase F1 subunit gamma [Oscillospiraceae bacterium]
MATANMKDVKRRIKSVESTKQITKAMELVASSKLRKAKERAEKAQPFFKALYETMCEIAGNNKILSQYASKNIVKTCLVVVIAGDRGLAGGFNHNVLKLAAQRIDELKGEGLNVKVLPLGKKSVEYFEKRKYDIVNPLQHIAEGMTIYKSQEIADFVIGMFKHGEIGSAELVYTTLVSALSQEPVHVKMLPVQGFDDTPKDKAVSLTIYDPSPEEVFDELIPKYLNGMIYGAIVDSFAAEQAARRTAMESASDNAGEMIDNLSLLYNRARQAQITQELTEIVSGSMKK